MRSHTYASSSRSASSAIDVAAVGELLERVERRRRADRAVGAAVHELQQLHRELDVADAAAAALQLAVVEAAAVRARPRLRAFIARISRTASGSSDVGPARAARLRATNARAELVVAGDRPRLEQRLELPRLRPPVPVRGRTRRGARLSAPERPSGRRSASVRNTMPSAVGSLIVAQHGLRGALGVGGSSPSCTNMTSTSLA